MRKNFVKRMLFNDDIILMSYTDSTVLCLHCCYFVCLYCSLYAYIVIVYFAFDKDFY